MTKQTTNLPDQRTGVYGAGVTARSYGSNANTGQMPALTCTQQAAVNPDGSSTLLRSYVWTEGLGAGVGGLLAVRDYSGAEAATYFPFYDGNGNVVVLTDAGGAVVASYEYDPFGKPLSADGPAANVCPFRYQTRYYDAETSSVHFPHNELFVLLGRWGRRDREGQGADPNPYRPMKGDPVNYIDPLGLDGQSTDRAQIMREITEWLMKTGDSKLDDFIKECSENANIKGVRSEETRLLGAMGARGYILREFLREGYRSLAEKGKSRGAVAWWQDRMVKAYQARRELEAIEKAFGLDIPFDSYRVDAGAYTFLSGVGLGGAMDVACKIDHAVGSARSRSTRAAASRVCRRTAARIDASSGVAG
jgi:RHS repeat-associated protein